MEPRIQYTKTADGVRIAYTTFGEGTPLVMTPLLIGSHLQLEWSVGNRRTAYERLAQRCTVVRYDPRGMGLSQQEAIDFSAEAASQDLAAVVDALELDRFALFLSSGRGSIPSTFMSEQTSRISRIVVWMLQRMVLTTAWRSLQKLAFLADDDWDLYTQIRARLVAGWDHPDTAPFYEMLRQSHSPESLRAADAVLWGGRTTAITLPEGVPALIVHPMANDAHDPEAIAETAASSRSAHVLGIPGMWSGPYPNEIAIAAIHQFMESGGAPGRALDIDRIDLSGAVKTILFTDLEAHTDIMQRAGDVKGRELLRTHEDITRGALREHGGAEVKAMGDGFMASFSSANKAIECAIALQRAFAAMDGGDETLRVRVGINAGEPIEENDDLFGSCVILASRTAARAGGGEILVTDVIRQLTSGKGFLFSDRGEFLPKGFEEPVRLHEVRWVE